jgi:hypothetical protein
VEIFFAGGLAHRRADRRRGPVVLRDGSFPVMCFVRVKPACCRSLPPTPGRRGHPASPGTLSRSSRTFDAACRDTSARACACAAKAVLLPATLQLELAGFVRCALCFVCFALCVLLCVFCFVCFALCICVCVCVCLFGRIGPD